MTYDFSGYATRADMECSDGRTIKPNAFKGDDGKRVPLCWQHGHSDVSNVLGYAVLENRVDGTYTYCTFNDTKAGREGRELVLHGDVDSLSIYANNLVERGKDVIHGTIREVSLVLAGANPGALIDNVILAHDGMEDIVDEEAVIYAGEKIVVGELAHSDEESDADNTEEVDQDATVEHATTAETTKENLTLQEIFDDMDEKEQAMVLYLINQIPTPKAESEDDSNDDTDDDKTAEHGDKAGDKTSVVLHSTTTDDALAAKEGTTMSRNVFQNEDSTSTAGAGVLTHADIKGIVEDARRMGSLKDSVEKYALQHGIENIDLMFPDAQAVTNTPDFVKRQTEWVADVMSGTRHTPFSRIKSLTADLTVEEARAKGYIKGNLKKEEFFALSKRTTTPQTVYKKQKLDRDDIVDITDFDVVTWLKAEMRIMLDEEVARAILIGDGRSNADEDKIKEENIRPIATDAELYVTTVYAKVTEDDAAALVDALVRHRRHYKGSGNPTFYTTEDTLAALLLTKDTIGRRLYPTVNDLAAALRVRNVVAVEVMEQDETLLGIMVNLQDYVVGSDKGGSVSLFDDFDIDYNQFKYLIETRLSGALVRPKSAVVVRSVAASQTLVEPKTPAYVASTGKITIPTVAGVTYESPKGTVVTGELTVAADSSMTVFAIPATGNYFATNAEDEWVFTRK